MATKATTLAGFDPSTGISDNDLFYTMKDGVEVKATAAQIAAYLNANTNPLAGASLDGGRVGVTPDITYQLLSIDGGTP